ncbi:hypothetical protein ACFL96_12085 [Thermoproteota archaeon]
MKQIKKGWAVTKVFMFLIVFVLTISFISPCSAWDPPPKTIDFRGFAYSYGTPIPDLFVMSIWANNGTLKMDETMFKYGNGYFRNLKIIWDDPSTPEDEGITYDTTTMENITFMINDVFAILPDNTSVKSSDEGATIDVNVYFRIITGVPDEEDEDKFPSPSAGAYVSGICNENWECTDWKPAVCTTETQTRTCQDMNNCGTSISMPEETRPCEKEVPEMEPPEVPPPPKTLLIEKLLLIGAPIAISREAMIKVVIGAGIAAGASVTALFIWILRMLLIKDLPIKNLLKKIRKIEKKEIKRSKKKRRPRR